MVSRKISEALDLRLIGLVGSGLLLISEFIPWFSRFSLWDLFILGLEIESGDFYFYLFPLISGLICLIGNAVILYREELKINSVIVNFIGLSFLLLFLILIVPSEFRYLSDAGFGFYVLLIGFLLEIVGLMNTLLMKS